MDKENLFLLTFIVQEFSIISATTLLFGITTLAHSIVCNVVVLNQIFFTVPEYQETEIQSPILKGVDHIIENEEKKSSNNFWAAKATAIHQIPNEVRNGVIATQILSNTINVAKIQTIICIIVFKISPKFFFVFASCHLNHFSIIKFNRYFINAEISIQTAIINNTAKTIRTVLSNGNHKEAKNKGNTIQEYQEIFANIWDNVLLSCPFFSVFLSIRFDIHFIRIIAINTQKKTEAEIIREL